MISTLMGVCFLTAAGFFTTSIQSFTLAWNHSIEKVRWEEDYVVNGEILELREARIHGSAAGMEPPPDAVLAGGVWHYRPAFNQFPVLRLTRSPYVRDYEFCTGGKCEPLQERLGPVSTAPLVEISACDGPHSVRGRRAGW